MKYNLQLGHAKIKAFSFTEMANDHIELPILLVSVVIQAIWLD
jgi:hypothetical protein